MRDDDVIGRCRINLSKETGTIEGIMNWLNANKSFETDVAGTRTLNVLPAAAGKMRVIF